MADLLFKRRETFARASGCDSSLAQMTLSDADAGDHRISCLIGRQNDALPAIIARLLLARIVAAFDTFSNL